MRGVERFFVLVALVYMAIYIPCFLIAWASMLGSQEPGSFFIILPFHFLGMALNVVALVLTMRDLYLQNFEDENAKLTWALLILMTGGIGWLVYVFKHALKPRDHTEAV